MDFPQINVAQTWKMLIQPERINYSIENLGPKVMCFQNFDCCRTDFSFTNGRGHQIHVSLFIPMKHGSPATNLGSLILNCPCLVYCHSQSGNRVEGLFLQEFCIEHGMGLCLFDFSGCGKSQGEFVTLGWKEMDDLDQLVAILTANYYATQVVLWGRSMGAVTSIMFAERNSMFLTAMILDSPFSDIKVMVQDIAYEQMGIPAMLSTVYLNLISQQIKTKVHFDILHIKPIEFAQNCTVPCVFIIGKQDKLVLPRRVTQIFEAYRGKQKQILSSSGQHSSEREPFIIKQCQDFIVHELRKNSQNIRHSTDRRDLFVESAAGPYLETLATAFHETLRHNLGRQLTTRTSGCLFGMKYNFESLGTDPRPDERGLESPKSYAYFDSEPRQQSNGHKSGPAWQQADTPVEITDEEFQAYLLKMNDLMKTERI